MLPTAVLGAGTACKTRRWEYNGLMGGAAASYACQHCLSEGTSWAWHGHLGSWLLDLNLVT